MRIALLEVSHWHFPLYQEVLRRANVEIVGISDRDPDCRERIGAYFDCPAFCGYDDLLASKEIDFAFAFGIHSEMPEIAKALLKKDIAFSIEKPCGTSLSDVAEIRKMAEGKGRFASIAFVYRLSPVLDFIKSVEEQLPSALSHLSIRNIAGSPERYPAAGVPWMLEKDSAGGGCLINLGGHFIDLAHVVTGAEPRLVYSRLDNGIYGEEIEDYGLIVLEMGNGASVVLETGYTFPHSETFKREFSLTYASRSAYIQSTENSLQAFLRADGASRHISDDVNLDTDTYFARYIEETLDRFRRQEDPVANLNDMYRVMSIIDRAYEFNGRL